VPASSGLAKRSTLFVEKFSEQMKKLVENTSGKNDLVD
jgi:hypothetical protein